MSKDKIKQELINYVESEFAESETVDTTKLGVLCARNRAFGAVMFAFCLDSDLYNELESWWNEDMLERFNSLMNKK